MNHRHKTHDTLQGPPQKLRMTICGNPAQTRRCSLVGDMGGGLLYCMWMDGCIPRTDRPLSLRDPRTPNQRAHEPTRTHTIPTSYTPDHRQPPGTTCNGTYVFFSVQSAETNQPLGQGAIRAGIAATRARQPPPAPQLDDCGTLTSPLQLFSYHLQPHTQWRKPRRHWAD